MPPEKPFLTGAAESHVGTSHRDMGPVAVTLSAPFPIEILWADLEIAPRV
jgi:hypothetical protein